MSTAFNLKDQDQYQEFFDMVIEDIEDTNSVDGQGFPLDEHDNPIDTDWLWENFGQHLDGTQTGLGMQVFNEVIKYYEPITDERKKEVIQMAKDDWFDLYQCGQINPDDDCDPKVLREYGLLTKAEQEAYTDTYDELVG